MPNFDDYYTLPPDSLGRRIWYESASALGMAIFNLGFSMRLEGEQHMPRDGAVLVLPNHQSFLDPWIVGIAVRRHLVYLARKTLFRNRFFAQLIRSFNAVPIDQDGVGKTGLQVVVKQLKENRAVLVFPEGERTPTGPMLPLKPGVHLVIKKAPSKIVPVGVAGAYDAYPRWRPYPTLAPIFLPARPSTLAVSVGPAFDSAPFADMPREKALKELFDIIHQQQQRAEKLRRK